MRLAIIVLAASAAACTHFPPANAAWTEGVTFTSMGPGTGAFSAVIDGATAAAAPYTIGGSMTKGGKIMPHSHPDSRVITVVDGELCYGFGDVFDSNGCKLYPEGSYFVVPANAPHFGCGKTGDAVYQESGVGPSAFNAVKSPAP